MSSKARWRRGGIFSEAKETMTLETKSLLGLILERVLLCICVNQKTSPFDMLGIGPNLSNPKG